MAKLRTVSLISDSGATINLPTHASHLDRSGSEMYWLKSFVWTIALLLHAENFILAQEAGRIDLPLGSSHPITKDSGLVQLIIDPKASTDRVEQIEQGVRIEKLSGKNSPLCGLAFKQGASKVFSFFMDLEVVQLSPPRTAGVQGLLVQFVMDRSPQEVFTVGIVRTNRGDRGILTYAGNEPKANEIQVTPLSFTKGTLLFTRESDKLRISISESVGSTDGPANYREVMRATMGAEPLKEIRIVCQRQDGSKPTSEFIVKRLQFSGDEFYSQPAPKPPYWTAERVYSALFWLCVLVLIVFAVLRANQIKDWFLKKFAS